MVKSEKSDFIPNSFQLPNAYSDLVMPWLTGEEWKVLSYLCRRIFGFRKQTDRVSLTQLQDGITTAGGKVLDFGTQLSRQTIINALDKLIEFGIVELVTPGDAVTQVAAEYSLNFDMTKVKLQDLADRKQKKKEGDKSRMKKVRASLSDRPAPIPSPADRPAPKNGEASLSDRPGLVYGIDDTRSMAQTDKVTVQNTVQNTDSGATEQAPAPHITPVIEIGANSKTRGEMDVLDGMIAFAQKAPAYDVADYPEEVQAVILRFCELWNIKPPFKNGKKGGEFGLWIADSRLVREALGEFGLDLLPEVKAEWDKDPFITGRPGAVIKLTRHVAGMKRGRNGGLKNSGEKPLSIEQRKDKFRNSGSINYGTTPK